MTTESKKVLNSFMNLVTNIANISIQIISILCVGKFEWRELSKKIFNYGKR